MVADDELSRDNNREITGELATRDPSLYIHELLMFIHFLRGEGRGERPETRQRKARLETLKGPSNEIGHEMS